MIDLTIEKSWKKLLSREFQSKYFVKLKDYLVEEKSNYLLFPPGNRIFSAFDFTPFHKTKVVILGQDPYHGHGQAHGLSFSVPDGTNFPPSLVNILKELKNDIDIETPLSGNLEKWAQQGVLLLNATLTVRAKEAGSHQKKGWETFTDAVIKTISDKKENIVFILWGNYAKAKAELIDINKHIILTAAHPSPLSAYKGFFGCKHFSKTNNYLVQHGIETINWEL